MPTEAQRIEFIKEVAPLAQKAYSVLGKVKPSVCIGMACIESGFGYGTDGSRLMYKHNAVLGQKVGTGKTATKYWSGKFFTSKTKEEYTVGTHTTITSAFRAYDNLEQCIFNYYELLNTTLYKKVSALADFATQMQQIKSAGYMTSSTEVNSVLNTIKKYNLNQYDPGGTAAELPKTETKPTLKQGDRNDYVKAWQNYLTLKGYDPGAADGIFGPKTLKAVKQYQKDNPACGDVDGIIGPKTWATVK